MKKNFFIITLLLLATTQSKAQNVNWRYFESEKRNLVQLNLGYDFGFTTQLGFSRMVMLYKPVSLGIDVLLPMGSTLFDDFKVRFGGQMEIVQAEGFALSVKIASNFRRYQNAFVRSVGFGSDFAAVAGYYSDTWHAAGEFGFDKAISTNLLHSDMMRSEYPEIKDGWYVPTGGHFYYGIQAGKTLSDEFDLGLRFGATRAQLNDDNAAIPYYLQLAFGTRF